MARHVYLHIGAMKSATTYCQGLCDHNAALLAKAGLLWAGASHNFLATDDLLGTRRPRPGLEGAWKAMDARLRAHDGDALLSNELLASIGPGKIERLVAALVPAEVHVIVTARDLAKVIPSQWQAGTRNRHTATWPNFVSSLRGEGGTDGQAARAFWRKHSVAALVTRWSKQVPLDRIVVVTVPPPDSPPSLLGEQFLSVVCVDPEGFEQPPYVNASLGGHSAELLRRINVRTEDLDWLHYKWGYKNALGRVVFPDRAGSEPPIALNQEQLGWVRVRARRMIHDLEATGVRVVGDLDDLMPAPRALASPADPTHATDGELLEAATDGLVGMGRMLADLSIEYDALIHELEAQLPPERPSERQLFEAADEQALDVATRDLLRNGRFVRWRLQGGAPTADPPVDRGG